MVRKNGGLWVPGRVPGTGQIQSPPPQSLTHVSCGLPKRQANLELGAGPDAAEGEAPGGQITRPPLACGHPNTAGESDGKRVAFF